MKKIFFMAGLPRSGSTLISSILNQNPEVYSSTSSPMSSLIFNIERSILASEPYKSFPKPKSIPKMLQGTLQGYYSDVDASYIIDKSRDWALPHIFETVLRNFDEQPKIIMPVRNIHNILASFINLELKNINKKSFIDEEIEQFQQMNIYRDINDVRCDFLMRPKGLIDNCLYSIAFSMMPQNKKYFHIIEYDDLIKNPKRSIDLIYDFLNIDKFDHDFLNIVNAEKENDDIYGYKGMHDVRQEISDQSINPENILSKYIIDKYSGLEFWRNNGNPSR